MGAALLLAGVLLVGCGQESGASLKEAGLKLVEKRDYAGASVQFKRALQKSGDSAELRHLLGRSLLEAGDPSQALVELQKALELPPPADALLADHARALLLQGETQKLTTLYGSQPTLKDAQSQASLKASLANAWGALGERKKAEAAAAAALAAQADFGPALILQARLLASGGMPGEAIAVLDQMLAREPTLHEAWQQKGEILWYGQRDREGTIQALKKAVEAKPTHLPAHLALVQVFLAGSDFKSARAQSNAMRQARPGSPMATYVDAQIAYFERNYDKARELILQLLKGAPNHTGSLQLAGAIESQGGSLPLALQYYGKALSLKPDLALARRNLAQTQLRAGQPAQALATLQPALAKGGGDADLLTLAGEAQLQLGQLHAAEASFRRASSLVPDNLKVRTALAMTALARGESEPAIAELHSLSASTEESTADLALISARLRRHQYDKALEAAQALLKKQPNNAIAAHMIGRVQLVKRDKAGARKSFEQALTIDPRYFPATASLAALDTIDGQTEKAQARYEAALKLDPRNYQARLALIELRQARGAKDDEVLALLTEAVKATPDEMAPRLKLINRLLGSRKSKEALFAAQDALFQIPHHPAAMDALGRAQAESGDPKQAEVTFKRLGKQDPGSGLAHVRLADVYRSLGATALAEESLKLALDVQPGLVPAQQGLLDLMLATNRHADALEAARRLQRRHATHPAGYALEASVHFRAKTPEAALEAYRRGLDKVAEGSDLAVALHKALVSQQRWSQADALASDWQARHPDDLAFEYQLALAAVQRKDLPAAELKLQRLLALRPDHPLALNNLAWVLVTRGKPGAIEHARRANELLPERPALMDTLAMALAADKKATEALDIQKRAVALSPNEAALRLNLARIALQAGDRQLAQQELKTLDGLGPNFAFRDDVVKLQARL